MRLVLNYVSFMLSAATFGAWTLRRERLDAILVYGTSPILQALPAVLLRKLKNAPLIVWVQDLWPESLRATGFITNEHVLRVVGWLVRWIYRHSDLLLVQSRAFVGPVRALAGGAL